MEPYPYEDDGCYPPHMYMSPQQNGSSSFESPHPPVHMYHPPYPYMIPSYTAYQTPWNHSPPEAVEYVTDIKSKDVLSGRGGATNSHSGNRAFRQLVKEFQGRYLDASKKDKPAVASEVVKIIRKRGGRFLDKQGTSPMGHVLYADIGDIRAREKTCQALREGAPEWRRRRKAQESSMDEDDATTKSSEDSPKSKTIRSTVVEQTLSPSENRPLKVTSKMSPKQRHAGSNIYLTPFQRLSTKLVPLGPKYLREYPRELQDIYLRDFQPPKQPEGCESKEAEEPFRSTE